MASELVTAELVGLDLSADTRDAALRAPAERLAAAGRVTDIDGFLSDVAAREAPGADRAWKAGSASRTATACSSANRRWRWFPPHG